MSAFGYSGSTVYRRRVALGVAVGREWVLGAAVEREWALGAAVEREWALGAAVEREWALVAAVADGMALGVGVADGLATAVAVEWFGLVEDDRAVGVGWSAPSAPDVSEIDMRTDRTRSPEPAARRESGVGPPVGRDRPASLVTRGAGLCDLSAPGSVSG